MVAEEPPRRLWQEAHGDDDENSEYDLEGDGKSPHEVIRAVRRSVIDPVGDQGAEGDDAALNANQQSSVGRLAAFGLIGRDCGSVDAVLFDLVAMSVTSFFIAQATQWWKWERERVAYPYTHNDSSRDHLCKRCRPAHGGNLDDNSQQHDERPEYDSPPPAENVADAEDEHGAYQAANLVDGGDQPLHRRVVPGCREHVVEGRRGNDTAHHTNGWVSIQVADTRKTVERLTLGHIRRVGSPSSQQSRLLARGACPRGP